MMLLLLFFVPLAVLAQNQDLSVSVAPPCSVGAECDNPAPSPDPPCAFGSKCGHPDDTQVDLENLPPSWDDKRTVAGTVQGVVKEDGTYVEGLTPTIITNRTRAFLNCTSGSMNVQIQFKEPFYGIIYANFDRHSSCRTLGEGGLLYTIDIPLRGCGTIQDPERVFINNIVVRFYSVLELDGDEVKTIICKYPPPVVPPVVPVPVVQPTVAPVPVPLRPDQLGELEILLIICSILFLAFLLLGVGCSYYCLKRRNIRIVKRKAASTAGLGSEITKITGSTLGQFDIGGLRIPRARASVSGSETNLVVEQSDTLPSDYPSESPSSMHSEVEDVDTRSLRQPSTVSSNTSTLKDLSSVYSDRHFEMDTETIEKQVIKRPEPTFEVAVRVKKPKPDLEHLKAQERQLSTILERGESKIEPAKMAEQGKIMTQEDHHMQAEIYRLPRPKRMPPGVISKIPPSDAGSIVQGSIPDNDNWSMSEYTIEESRRTAPMLPPASDYASEARSVSDIYEPEGQLLPRKPQTSSHLVDDRLLSTVTETRTYDDIERHTREITEYYTKPKPEPISWDVIIRNYPAPKRQDDAMSSGTEWERFSETESERQTSIFDGPEDQPVEPVPPPPKNWQVLIRVLKPPVQEEDTISVLSEDDKTKWAQIITTESTLRTMLTEATHREDFEKIRQDQRYVKLFEPKKWDVIIRVLTPPEDQRQPRYRKKSDYDNRSRRSSLPPVYESDTDTRSRAASTRSRRTSHSSIPGSEYDLRSMTEVDVDFTRYDRDSLSEISGHTSRYPRSIADRATSEIVEDIPTVYRGKYAGSLGHRSLPDSETTDWEPVREEATHFSTSRDVGVHQHRFYQDSVSSPEHSPIQQRFTRITDQQLLEQSTAEVVISSEGTTRQQSDYYYSSTHKEMKR